MQTHPSRPPVVIGSVAELQAFASSPGFVSKRQLALRIPEMSPQEAFVSSERLNTYRSECGCSFGARAMTAAFVFALALLVVVYGPLSVALLVHLPLAIGAAVLFAVLGKFAGIAAGRRRARREAARIIATFIDRS
jgi:hypothetical protein